MSRLAAGAALVAGPLLGRRRRLRITGGERGIG